MREVGEGHPGQLLARIAGELAEPLVVLQPRAVDGNERNADRRVLEGVAETSLPVRRAHRWPTRLAHERDHLIDGRQLDHREL
jgi:hypothetical protein